jgi:hypothetical protein
MVVSVLKQNLKLKNKMYKIRYTVEPFSPVETFTVTKDVKTEEAAIEVKNKLMKKNKVSAEYSNFKLYSKQNKFLKNI